MKLQTAAIVIFSMLLSGSTSFAQQTQTQPQRNSQPATTPVPVQSVVFIAPSNSRISFVGVHVGDDPKPRLGGFSQFQGYCVVDPDNKAVNSIVIDIDVDSVWTQFEKLTGHLKNADFFETAKFPAARFVSTGIKAGENGQCSRLPNTLCVQSQARSWALGNT